eukprot:281575-Amphidinium_carterae.1
MGMQSTDMLQLTVHTPDLLLTPVTIQSLSCYTKRTYKSPKSIGFWWQRTCKDQDASSVLHQLFSLLCEVEHQVVPCTTHGEAMRSPCLPPHARGSLLLIEGG